MLTHCLHSESIFVYDDIITLDSYLTNPFQTTVTHSPTFFLYIFCIYNLNIKRIEIKLCFFFYYFDIGTENQLLFIVIKHAKSIG